MRPRRGRAAPKSRRRQRGRVSRSRSAARASAQSRARRSHTSPRPSVYRRSARGGRVASPRTGTPRPGGLPHRHERDLLERGRETHLRRRGGASQRRSASPCRWAASRPRTRARSSGRAVAVRPRADACARDLGVRGEYPPQRARDRKSTRLNSSHVEISYAVFCLKKKKKKKICYFYMTKKKKTN